MIGSHWVAHSAIELKGVTDQGHCYRPQHSCGKVMFSQVSVILFTGGGMCGGGCARWGACVAGGVWGRLACVAGGGGMHGRGPCMAGGMCDRGHA